MKKNNTFLILFALLLAAGALIFSTGQEPVIQASSLIPRHVIFGNPEKTQPKISPDGKWIAYIAPDANEILNVWVAPAHDLSQSTLVTHDEKRGIRSYFWQWDGSSILYLQDVDGNEDWHLFQTKLKTDKTRDLTPYKNVRVDVLCYSHQYPDEILVQMNQRDPKFFDVHRIQLDSSLITLDTENSGNIHDFVADHRMQVRASQEYREDGGTIIRIRDDAHSPWRELISWGPKEGLGGISSFTPDGKGLYLLTSLDHNTVQLSVLDIATKKMTPLATDPYYDVGGLMLHPITHAPQAASIEREYDEWIVLDEKVKPDFEEIERFAGKGFSIVSRTLDDQTWLIAKRSTDAPSEFYRYNRADQSHELLFTTMPALKQYTLAPKTPISYTARDGLTIHGYLSLPVHKPQTNLPTIIYVHGGPWVRDSADFSPTIQWLANRGYAVLQVNYRGSTGYGKAFVNAGDKEWGAKMHDDVLDAKRWLVDQKVADPNRIAVFGGSYGGYETLVALSFTPQEFCCGVDVVGPSNLITLLQTIPSYWEAGRALFDTRVGRLTDEMDLLTIRSPLFRANEIVKPLLIAQGANDPRVKKSESDQIVEAIRRHEKPVSYLVFDDEGHGFVRPENKKRFYAAVEHFLAENLGGEAEPPSPNEEWHDFLR